MSQKRNQTFSVRKKTPFAFLFSLSGGKSVPSFRQYTGGRGDKLRGPPDLLLPPPFSLASPPAGSDSSFFWLSILFAVSCAQNLGK